MAKKKVITGYQVRNEKDNGIRLCRLSLEEAKNNCPYGCAVWSIYRKVCGIRLRFFWMHPFRKVKYDKYSRVVNFFHFHIGWDLMKRDALLEKVYEPIDMPMSGEVMTK